MALGTDMPVRSGACESLAGGGWVPALALALVLTRCASPGTSQERSISSRSLALSLFECFAPFLPFWRWRSNASTSLSALVSAKSSSTMSSRSSSGARGYGHRVDSAWKGTSARCAREEPVREGGAAGPGEAATVAMVGGGLSWGTGTGGADETIVGRTAGAEWWDDRVVGVELDNTFSDDANPRNGGRGVTSPSSCFPLRFACGFGRSSIGESASCRSSLLSTSPSYRRCEDATLLVRLGGIPSSAEITSCVRICGSCDVVGCGESIRCVAACGVGDGGSEDSGSDEEISLRKCAVAVAKERRVDGGAEGGGGKGSELT